VFQGRIREVRQAPTTIQNVVTYAAVIDAPNPERKLRQGMTASVTIVTDQRDDVLRVANAALRYRPAGDGADGERGRRRGGGGTPGVARAGAGDRNGARPGGDGELRKGARRGEVYTLASGKPDPIPVQIGISDGRQTEVIDGLREGDAVVVGDSVGTSPPRRRFF
jgi:HlyD family secretion protein